MKDALKQAIRQSEEQVQSCPACGSEQLDSQGSKRRVLLTSFGRVEVALRRKRCKQCRHVFRFAQRCLVEVKGANVTADLRELAALVGCSWPYETAAGVLARLSGVQLSDERLRQLTNEQGQQVAKAQREQAEEAMKEAVSMPQIRAQRERSEHPSPCLVTGGIGWGLAAVTRAGGRDGRQDRGGGQSAGRGGQTRTASSFPSALRGHLRLG
ncbi:MAG TPA: hypothetical protein VFV38_28465 [Ktedonobacteraceae bacterium]|nr:hypothetical protein [Ktedonobacteraceae bacterium]